MTVDAGGAASQIESALQKAGTPERAEGQKRYLKSELIFFGSTMADVNEAVRRCIAEPELSRGDLIDVATELWAEPIFDRRIAAAKLLSRRVQLLRPTDLAFIRGLIQRSDTWALVDPLAVDVVGGIVLAHPKAAGRLDAWAAHGDFWVRRSALLGLLRSVKAGRELDRFEGFADEMLEEREFFIRKAIGWVLRELSKKDPAAVYRFMEPRAHRASGVTIREAVKYLPEAQKARLMETYRSA